MPFVFLANGEEMRFWDWQREAHPRPVKTFFKQDDLERRIACAPVERDPLTVPIDRRIVERDYQTRLHRDPVPGDSPRPAKAPGRDGHRHRQDAHGRGVHQAAVRGQCHHAACCSWLTASRSPSRRRTRSPSICLTIRPTCCRAGRRFQDEKRITITTLQSMINIYRDYSSGYFDLVISDECHRSIYGKWSGVLEHFDGVQIGLTATPCVANRDDYRR